MNVAILEQTAIHLSRQTRQWDRRLRLVMSIIWVPRGVIAGLMLGIVIAVVSRLRPWLLSEEIATGAAVAVLVCAAGTLAAVWVWPRSVARNARFFDHRFDLKERVSTALELTGGLIPLPETLTERQLNDAVTAVRNVNVAERMPFRVRFWEILTLLALAALLIYLLIARNPKADELLKQRELDNAIQDQITELEQAIEDIEANENLTAAEQEALTAPLENALDILQQSGVSQQEAMAALAEASENLGNMSDGMGPEQESAYQDAANELAQSEMTSDLAQAFQEPDLSEAGEAMEDMAEQMKEEDLTEQQREELAEHLEQAAEQIEETNPALAEKMRETAEALREGDMEAAQQAAREAGELLRQQEQALKESPSAQAAQNAQEQVDQSQRELAQTGQEQEPQQGAAQTGENVGQEGEQQVGEGELQQSQGSEQTEGEGESAGEQTSETSLGESQTSGEGEAQEAQANLEQEPGGPNAGEGEGGAGEDTTTGTQEQLGEGEVPSNQSTGESEVQEFQPEFESSTIGGESENVVDVSSENPGTESETVQEGEFGPNPEGESTLSYTGVYNEYRDIVSDALESGRIPLDQRDVIHDYFSSLDQ